MWSSASLGAIGGFWLSWRLGIRYRHRLTHLRWLTAERLARSRLFFQRYGPWAIFFSRFLSPLRATLPFVSGASSLPLWSFQLANVSSGLLWPLLLLAPGAFSLSLW
ncbi:DedA-family integral membrane protein [Klebsiella pneumoniae]|nr:DedA-family integral membrane protein [Klebsiella pneumoniae]